MKGVSFLMQCVELDYIFNVMMYLMYLISTPAHIFISLIFYSFYMIHSEITFHHICFLPSPMSLTCGYFIKEFVHLQILVSTTLLSPNQPVIELRGKYMLSTQHRPPTLTVINNKRTRPPPGPFIFFYRLPKDGTEVCVDTRTYGNDARFIRRSCKPNAEVSII